jgi:selenocysteine lyase/cysteine desulfurase
MSAPAREGLFRDLYPGAHEHIYLDAAAVGITSTRVRDAMNQTMLHHEHLGIAGADERDHTLTRTRERVASLIGGHSARVAFTQNTSTGLAIAANGIDWAQGDNILVPAGEFPSNFYPWVQLRRHGVELREIPMTEGHADLRSLRSLTDDRTRMLAISAVQYSSGYRYDLAELGEYCRGAGILLVVDATQAAGALDIQAERDGVDLLAISAHKWMLGPLGIGFVHLSEKAMDSLRPSVVGWLSVEHPFDFDHEPLLAQDARRFESGTENAVGLAGLDASISLMLEAGTQTIEDHILDSTEELSTLLDARGWSHLRNPDRTHWSGILISTTGAHDDAMFARLRDAGVRCSRRGGGIRFSPHYYTSSDDLYRIYDLAKL